MAAAGEHGTGTVVAAGLATQAVLAAGGVAAHVVTGSMAVLAVGLLASAGWLGHLLLAAAGRRARREADDLRPVGAGRVRYFWSFAVTTVLMAGGAVYAVDRGVALIDDDRLRDVVDPAWDYGVLSAGAVLAVVTLMVAVRQGNKVRGRATWPQHLRHARAPEVPVVVLQAVWALVATAVAAGAVAATDLADEPQAEGIGTAVIGGLMGLGALVLLAEMRSLLIGEAASRKDVESIRAAVEIDPTVKQLIHMRAQHQGPEELLVGMKVELDHTLTFPEVSEVVNRIERNVRRAVPMARTTYIEPDVTDARRAAPTIGEHDPGHDVPQEIRAKQKIEDERGALGVGIPLEDGL